MKRQLLLIALFMCSLMASGQSNQLFERFDFDTTCLILAVCSPFNTTGKYQELTFIIKDIKKLTLAKKTIFHGDRPGEPIYGEDGLNIHLIKDKRVIQTYEVSPKYGHVSYHPTDSTHGIFKFDVFQLQQLADMNPIKYHIKNYSFKSKKEFNVFLLRNKYSRDFLGYNDISEGLAGRFSVVIAKGDRAKSIQEASALVKTELKRITPNKSDYICGYDLTNSSTSTFFFSINSSKDIYNNFKLAGYQKSKWTENLIEISTFWLN